MSTSRFYVAATVAALFCLALAPVAWSDGDTATEEKPKVADSEAEKPKAVELDAKLPPVTMTDTDGKALDIHDCGVTQKDAEGVVMAAAKKFGAGDDAKADTKIADLSGVKDEDGALDPDLVKNLACEAGSYFGLTATEDTVGDLKTLGDVTKWIVKANDAPILLVTWSPNCPSVKRANDRMIEVAAKTGVRLFAIACNTRDKDEHYAKYKDAFEFHIRVFPDREQKVTDILGGKTTPHFFLLDKDAVLRYRGALDNDPMGYMDDEEREEYIALAAAAIRAGKDVETKDTKPSG